MSDPTDIIDFTLPARRWLQAVAANLVRAQAAGTAPTLKVEWTDVTIEIRLVRAPRDRKPARRGRKC